MVEFIWRLVTLTDGYFSYSPLVEGNIYIYIYMFFVQLGRSRHLEKPSWMSSQDRSLPGFLCRSGGARGARNEMLLLMVEELPARTTTVWMLTKPVAKNVVDFNYQPQLVSRPDFWTIKMISCPAVSFCFGGICSHCCELEKGMEIQHERDIDQYWL